MIYEIRLRTGFFETTSYTFMIKKNQIVLSPLSADGKTKDITICDASIVSVLLRKKKNPELEIQTKDKVYLGTLGTKIDLSQVFQVLKKELNTKIIYEGGSKKDE